MRERIKPMVRLFAPFIIFLGISAQSFGNRLLIPMDDSQKNHLKAYGISYWILKSYEMEMDWLLNYRGGSFMVAYNQQFASEMTVRGVSFEVISEGQAGTDTEPYQCAGCKYGCGKIAKSTESRRLFSQSQNCPGMMR